MTGELSSLEAKISLINDAHATAESLPIDLQILKDARRSIQNSLQVAQTNQAGAETARNQAEAFLTTIGAMKEEAEKLVQGTENAFSAAMTKGLGEEFGNRATQLSKDIWKLGGVLAATLLVGGVITYLRIDHINELLNRPDFNMQIL